MSSMSELDKFFLLDPSHRLAVTHQAARADLARGEFLKLTGPIIPAVLLLCGFLMFYPFANLAYTIHSVGLHNAAVVAKVVRVSGFTKECRVSYFYSYKGREYRGSGYLPRDFPRPSKGSEMRVQVSRNDPSISLPSIRRPMMGDWPLTGWMGLLGLVLIGGGGFTLLRTLRKAHLRFLCLTKGTITKATLSNLRGTTERKGFTVSLEFHFSIPSTLERVGHEVKDAASCLRPDLESSELEDLPREGRVLYCDEKTYLLL